MFFFNDTATTEIYTLSLHDALPIYIDAYLARFPLVQDFIARTIEQATRDGYVTTLFGRRRPVPEIRASNRQTRGLGERLAVNSVMQGTAADVIKVAMVRIHRRLRDEGRAARLVLQVHDELLLEVPDVEVSAVRELVRAEMCGAYPLDPPLAVDIGAGDDWNEAKSQSASRLGEAVLDAARAQARAAGRPDPRGYTCQLRDGQRHGGRDGRAPRRGRLDARSGRRARSRLRLDVPDDQRGRGRPRDGRPGRQGRGPRRHRLQVGGRHP